MIYLLSENGFILEGGVQSRLMATDEKWRITSRIVDFIRAEIDDENFNYRVMEIYNGEFYIDSTRVEVEEGQTQFQKVLATFLEQGLQAEGSFSIWLDGEYADDHYEIRWKSMEVEDIMVDAKLKKDRGYMVDDSVEVFDVLVKNLVNFNGTYELLTDEDTGETAAKFNGDVYHRDGTLLDVGYFDADEAYPVVYIDANLAAIADAINQLDADTLQKVLQVGNYTSGEEWCIVNTSNDGYILVKIMY